MASRKFVSISGAGNEEDGYCLLAVASDGTAWISDTLIAINMASVDDLQWYPVASLPEPEKSTSSWDGFK